MQSWILYLLFFSLPFQTRLLLFQGPNEYQSIFLYGTDLLIGLLFVFWASDLAKGFTKSDFVRSKPLVLPAFFIIGWFFLSSIFSQNPLLGFWRTLKIAEFLWLFFYVLSLPRAAYGNVLKILLASGVFQSVLAIGQFLTQHDFRLRILGENILAPDIAGAAKIEVLGEKFIRAYGTFPHPNVLAVFLLFCIFALLFLYKKEIKSLVVSRWSLVVLPILTLALLLTFSRVVIVIGTTALIFWFLFTKDRPRHIAGVFLLSLLVFGSILFPFFQERVSLSFNDQAVALRLFYAKNAIQAIGEDPIFGVGPGQFTSFQQPIIQPLTSQSWANQPVHNIYLLLASETGLPALFFLSWFIIEAFRAQSRNRRHWKLEIRNWIFPIALGAIGLFDHFFLTFQQGALIFWTALAFCCKK